MKEILKMKIPGNPEYIQIAKVAAASAANLEGFNIECIDEIKMAVGEACKAITCHGSEKWSSCYEMILEVEKDFLKISIIDSSCGNGIEKNRKVCLDCPKEGDLGIQILKTLVDDLQLVKKEDGCKSIVMVKKKC